MVDINSVDIVVIDPPVVQGLFGSRPNKRRHHIHNPMTISKEYDRDRNNPLVTAIKDLRLACCIKMESRLELKASVDAAALALSSEFQWVGEGKITDKSGRVWEGKFVDTLRWYAQVIKLMCTFEWN